MGVRSTEAEGFHVVKYEIALCGLVKLKFDDLRPVLIAPELGNPDDGLYGHTSFFVLGQKVLISGRTNHKLDLRIQFGLRRWVQRDCKLGRDVALGWGLVMDDL